MECSLDDEEKVLEVIRDGLKGNHRLKNSI